MDSRETYQTGYSIKWAGSRATKGDNTMTEPIVVTLLMVLKDLFLKAYGKGYFSVNTVYSGFNQVARIHFNEDPIAFTNDLKAKGLIEGRGDKSTKNGVTHKSALIWLTEKGMTEFGIRPPTAQAKPTTGVNRKVDQIVKDAEKRYILRKSS
jgi:hypothetical protein